MEITSLRHQVTTLQSELQISNKEQQTLLQQKGELYQSFIEEKDKSSAIQQEKARLEAQQKLEERETE